jgi:hypothetical protein
MKNALASVMVFMTLHVGAAIIAGPLTNPKNGHEYYLLSPNSWTASEGEAEELGGTLAIIRNAGEQEWVFSTFGAYGGTPHALWIGLHRKDSNGPFVWMDGSRNDYTDWYPTEPNNAGGHEDCVHMRSDPSAPGSWNDQSCASIMNAVVEVAAKSSQTIKRERALLGVWYENGNAERRCYITSGENAVFGINGSFASRLISYKNGVLFAPSWRVHGEIVTDKILWSNGTWWSRKPMRFDSAAARESVKVEGMDRAAGKEYDSPELRGGGE